MNEFMQTLDTIGKEARKAAKKKYKVYNHNHTLLGEFKTKREANKEAREYTNATGNAAYIEG